MSEVRNRIKRHVKMRAGDLLPHELNFREHPKAQIAALKGVYEEVGFARSLLGYETEDGVKLIDGHLRRDIDPEMEVDVEILDVDDAEAKLLLSVMDPLAALAETNGKQLDLLLREIDTTSPAVEKMLADLAKDVGLYLTPDEGGRDGAEQISLPDKYAIVIPCSDEAHQRRLLEKLTTEGVECRALIV